MAGKLTRFLLMGFVLIVLGLLLVSPSQTASPLVLRSEHAYVRASLTPAGRHLGVPHSSWGRGVSPPEYERGWRSHDDTPQFNKWSSIDDSSEFGPAKARWPGPENGARTNTLSSPPFRGRQPETVYLETWQPFPLYGGEMTSIAMGPIVSDTAGWETVYVGTRDAGVFKTLDGGRVWQPARAGLSFYPIRSLQLDPQDPNVVYAGTDFDGIWKSIDGGNTWAKSSTGLDESLIVFDIKIDPQDTDTLYAGLGGGVALVIGNIYKSEDGGATWTLKDAGMPRSSETSTHTNAVFNLAIDPDNPSLLYAGTNFIGVYRSENAGGTWNAITEGLPFLSYPDWYSKIGALAVDPHHSNRASAIAGGKYYVFDDAAGWQQVSNDTLGSTSHLYFHPTDPSIIYCPNSLHGFSKSTDGGVSWDHFRAGIFDVAFHPLSPNTLYGAHGSSYKSVGGVYKSNDQGETWSEAWQGITAQTIQSVAIDPQNFDRIYAGTGSGYFFRTQDGGLNWEKGYYYRGPIDYHFGAISDIAVDPLAPQNVYVAATGGLFKSTNYGEVFEEIDQVLNQKYIDIASDSTNSIYIATSASGVYKSLDGGATWTQKNEGLPTFGSGLCPILSLAVDPNNPETVWLGTQFSGGILKSSDGGDTWQTKGLTDTNFVEAIAINPDDRAEMLAGGGFWDGRIYKSTDGGETWGIKLEGIAFVQDIVYDPRDSRKVYAATEGYGVLRSFDGGDTWYSYSQGIFYPLSYSLDITDQDPALLIAGSYGSGLYWTYPSLANQPPNLPSNPWPGDGTDGASLETVLRWAGGDPDGDPLTYTLAFGSDDPPPLVASTPITTHDPGPLDIDTAYYWQITASDGLSQTVGPVWSFSTVGVHRLYLPLVLRQQ